MLEVGIRELKARASELVRRVVQHREEVVITKHGRPVARIVPTEQEAPAQPHEKQLLGLYKDILPDVTWEEWEEFEREIEEEWQRRIDRIEGGDDEEDEV